MIFEESNLHVGCHMQIPVMLEVQCT
jgi:hypothetical protein